MLCITLPRPCSVLQAIDAGRRQYAELLADLGFIPASYASAASAAGGRGGGGGGGGGRRGGGGMSASVSNPYGEGEEKPLHEVDEHSANARTVKAALCCGFYPQVPMGCLLRARGCGKGGRVMIVVVVMGCVCARWPPSNLFWGHPLIHRPTPCPQPLRSPPPLLSLRPAVPAAAASGAPRGKVCKGAGGRPGDGRRPLQAQVL